MRRGRFVEARDALDRVAAAGATVPVLLDLARAAGQAGDHKKGALGYLAHARSLEPENAVVHFLFGIVCIELELGAEAYESLKKAVALDPENPPANYMMGAVSLHRHDPSEAVPYLEKYLRLSRTTRVGDSRSASPGFTAMTSKVHSVISPRSRNVPRPPRERTTSWPVSHANRTCWTTPGSV